MHVQTEFEFPGRKTARRASTPIEELIVDNFAGGGGASLGIERALGRAVDLSINHDRAAVEMHAINHPASKHLCEDVWAVDPVEATKGRPVGLAWFSPDCKHFSRAKGGKPVEKKIRGLAWIVVKWAKAVRPRVIILENVREFETWGPLRDDNTPCPDRKGLTFKRWVGRLKGLGYQVQWRTLNAADYGAPTHRRRLFLIARRDGQPIVWPEATHGPGRAAPWRTAAECIDWSILCPSIFSRKKPLAEKTLRRIAMGIKRYVLDNPKPFIVRVNHGRDEFRGQSIDEPLSTVTGKHGQAIVSPTLATVGYGERKGQAPRAPDIAAPLGTVVGSQKHALVAPALIHYHTEKGNETRASDVGDPIPTQTTENRFGLVSAFVKRDFGASVGHAADEPLGTVTGGDRGGSHAALVYAFLTKYFGTAIGSNLGEPLHTISTRDRFAVVMVDGSPHIIADIGMRMLAPRELARAQGFPDDYELLGSKANQVKMIGNSVCPVMAEALAGANVPELRAPNKSRRSSKRQTMEARV